MKHDVTVVGAGLAGCEGAWQLARDGSQGTSGGDEAGENDAGSSFCAVCRAGVFQLPAGRFSGQRCRSAQGGTAAVREPYYG